LIEAKCVNLITKVSVVRSNLYATRYVCFIFWASSYENFAHWT